MKKFVLVALTFFFTLGAVAQVKNADKPVQQADPDGPVITFESTTIDYGTIEKGADGKRVFKFTNTGKSPLKITRVKSSCGCAVANYPKEAIMPGESGEIKVKFDTRKPSRFSKSISIFTNAYPERVVLRVKGIVVDPNAPVRK